MMFFCLLAALAPVDGNRQRPCGWWVAYAALRGRRGVHALHVGVRPDGAVRLGVSRQARESAAAAARQPRGRLLYVPWVPELLDDRNEPAANAHRLASSADLHEREERSSATGRSGTHARGHPGPRAASASGRSSRPAGRRARRPVSGRGDDRPAWPPPAGVVFVVLAAAAPVGAILENLVAPSVFIPRNIISSWPATALTAGVLVTAGASPLRIAATALLSPGSPSGGQDARAWTTSGPTMTGAVRYIERPGDRVRRGRGPEPTPGPQTALEAAFAPTGAALRRAPGPHSGPPELQDQVRGGATARGLNHCYPCPSPGQVAHQAVRDARGGTIFLVAGDVSLEQLRRIPGPVSDFLGALPPGYHEVESRSFPGLSYLPPWRPRASRDASR